MAQKERFLKKLANLLETGEKLYTENLTILWKGQTWKIDFLTKHTDGRILACMPNRSYNPKLKDSRPFRAIYVDDLPTLEAVKIAKDAIQTIEEATQNTEEK